MNNLTNPNKPNNSLTVYDAEENVLLRETLKKIAELQGALDVTDQRIKNWSEIQVIKADVILEMELGLTVKK